MSVQDSLIVYLVMASTYLCIPVGDVPSLSINTSTRENAGGLPEIGKRPQTVCPEMKLAMMRSQEPGARAGRAFEAGY